jgi:hypothetical protein
MSFLQLLLNPGKRTLAEVVLKLPNQGVGSRVTRRTWAPFGNSYWEVTRVVPKGEEGKDTEVGRHQQQQQQQRQQQQACRQAATAAAAAAAAGSVCLLYVAAKGSGI